MHLRWWPKEDGLLMTNIQVEDKNGILKMNVVWVNDEISHLGWIKYYEHALEFNLHNVDFTIVFFNGLLFIEYICIIYILPTYLLNPILHFWSSTPFFSCITCVFLLSFQLFSPSLFNFIFVLSFSFIYFNILIILNLSLKLVLIFIFCLVNSWLWGWLYDNWDL